VEKMSWYEDNKPKERMTNEKFIAMVDSLESHEIRSNDLTVYWALKNKCMGCGCPVDNPQMKNSSSPYYCLICEKKMLGDEVYNRKQEKLNNWIDKTQGMTLKEKFNLVKKSLIFGVSND
jgi:hypothetical protein